MDSYTLGTYVAVDVYDFFFLIVHNGITFVSAYKVPAIFVASNLLSVSSHT